VRRLALKSIICAVALATLTGFSFAAYAHKASDSYLSLRVEGSNITGRWDIALRDLDLAIGLDANQDGQITWGEVRMRQPQVAAYALSRLSLDADGTACSASVTGHAIDRHSDGAYSVLDLAARCTRAPTRVTLDYRLLFDLDAQHRGLLRLDGGGQTRTAILSPEAAAQAFSLRETSLLSQLGDYFVHGVWHIWIGFDHILFLLSLLLPAVLIRHAGNWEPASGLSPALTDVLKVVTAFTLAHSITLSLAAVNWVHLPSRLVESTIAVSVIFAAINNMYPVVTARRWLLAFVFGLIHGFGFASVLSDLQLPRESLLTALIAFNAGVEAGQLAIVGLFIPLAWALRRSWFYSRLTIYAGSSAVLVLATVWLLERAFDIRLVS
jgi:hypothetical protein